MNQHRHELVKPSAAGAGTPPSLPLCEALCEGCHIQTHRETQRVIQLFSLPALPIINESPELEAEVSGKGLESEALLADCALVAVIAVHSVEGFRSYVRLEGSF